MNHDDMESTIQNFRKGTPSQEEQKKVQQYISNKEEWKEEYQLQNNLEVSISEVEHEKIKNLFIEHEKNRKGNLKRRNILISAVFIFLIAMLYFLLQSNSAEEPKSVEDIYAAHWQPTQNLIAPLTRKNEPTSLQEAMQLYEEGEYLQAFNALSQLSETDYTPEVELYKATCLIALGRYEEAGTMLFVLDFSNPIFEFEKEWNLGIVELMNGNVEQSRSRFSEMLKNQSNTVLQNRRAGDILDELNSIGKD